MFVTPFIAYHDASMIGISRRRYHILQDISMALWVRQWESALLCDRDEHWCHPRFKESQKETCCQQAAEIVSCCHAGESRAPEKHRGGQRFP